MKKRKKPPTPRDDKEKEEDDGVLFRRAVAGTRPLQRDFVETMKARPVPRARFRRRDEAAALEESLDADLDDIETFAGERLRFRRPEVGPRTLKRLARGSYSVQNELDLHGMTMVEAEAALQVFMNDCLAAGHRCVRIVHGKGLGSGNRGPVLKPRVLELLTRWRDVLAFASARHVDGGSGAVYVLLRAR